MSIKAFTLSLILLIIIVYRGLSLNGLNDMNSAYWVAFLLAFGFSGVAIVVLLVAIIQLAFYKHKKLLSYGLILLAFSAILWFIGSFARYNRLF